VRAYELFQCRDYARVDMRVDQKGVPYILEVNCNPDISPEAGFFRAFSSNGRTYADLVAMLISFVEERIQTREPLRMVPKKMKVGLTYNLGTDYTPTEDDPLDVVAEFDNPTTIEGLEAAIRSNGHEPVRVGDGQKLFEWLRKNRADLIFNI